MARLIEADAVKQLLKNFGKGAISDGQKTLDPVDDIILLSGGVDYIPTVDAVEVVRCKECRWSREIDHREPTDTPRPLICQCFKHHHIPAPWGARLAVEPDDFCSYGERRD